MSNKNEQRARTAPNLKPVDAGVTPAKPKKERKPRASGGTDFASQARALVAQHRTKMSKLVEAERKAEIKLAQIKAQREAAEGPLREVEEILARRPELPGLEPVAETAPEPMAPTETLADSVNQ